MAFVHGNFEDFDVRKTIVMLVRNRYLKKMRILVLYADPWKDIDHSKPFDMPEHFFTTSTNIAKPVEEDHEARCIFLNDKIKNVSFLPKKPFKDRVLALVV